jgi:hypothetical protein
MSLAYFRAVIPLGGSGRNERARPRSRIYHRACRLHKKVDRDHADELRIRTGDIPLSEKGVSLSVCLEPVLSSTLPPTWDLGFDLSAHFGGLLSDSKLSPVGK